MEKLYLSILRSRKKTTERIHTENDDVPDITPKHADTTEEEYDVLGQERKDHQPDVIYDHANNRVTGIYDVTTRDGFPIRNDETIDNMYDHGVMGDEHDLFLYDKSQESEVQKCLPYTTEEETDTYSQLKNH